MILYYKCSNYRHEFETGILWNDKTLKIKWPNKKPIVSDKDKKMTFKEFFFNILKNFGSVKRDRTTNFELMSLCSNQLGNQNKIIVLIYNSFRFRLNTYPQLKIKLKYCVTNILYL